MAPATPHANGASHNGLDEASCETLGARGLIHRTEYVRLLEQALRGLGYEQIAAQLEAASGIEQQSPEVERFRRAVLSGGYVEAEALLCSVAADEAVMERARFLLLRQKYLEGVQRGHTAQALQVLRQELQPMRVQHEVLHSLAALLLRPPDEAAAGGGSGSSPGCNASPGQLVESRAALLNELQDSLMPSLLIPERRLEELVEQALVSQLDRSRYHNCLHTRLSLFTDYQAGADQLPTQPSQVLEEHGGEEVWCVTFSQDGRWAASAGKDGAALLWPVTSAGRLERPRPLLRQAVPCQLVCFSPDGQLALTVTEDGGVRLHELPSAQQLRAYPPQEDSVVAASWFPDSRHFLVATHRQLLVFGARQAGTAPRQCLRGPHSYVYDAVVGPGGTCIISVGQDRKIAFTRLSDQRVEAVAASGTVTSMHLSPCGRFLTTNLNDSCVHLWQLPPGLGSPQGAAAPSAALASVLDDGSPCSPSARQAQGAGGDPLDALPSAPLQEFRMADARPSRYVLRSCVGGATSGFVACGAEDGGVYLWSRAGELLACLPGHSGCVNTVAWHPRNPHLIATASDDGTIRTWLAPAVARASHGGG